MAYYSRFAAGKDIYMDINNLKKKLPLIFLILGGLLILGGVLMLIFGAGDSFGFLKVMFIITSIVMILLGCTCIYFVSTLTVKADPNFFLYETSTKTNMPIEELTFEHVNRKMTYFMSHVAKNAREVWEVDVVGSENEIFGDENQFRPLAAYKVIFDLEDRGNETMWALYLGASDEIIVSIVDALALGGDVELGKAIRQLHKNAEGDAEKTQKFLSDNKVYIQKKMLKYVKANIEKF